MITELTGSAEGFELPNRSGGAGRDAETVKDTAGSSETTAPTPKKESKDQNDLAQVRKELATSGGERDPGVLPEDATDGGGEEGAPVGDEKGDEKGDEEEDEDPGKRRRDKIAERVSEKKNKGEKILSGFGRAMKTELWSKDKGVGKNLFNLLWKAPWLLLKIILSPLILGYYLYQFSKIFRGVSKSLFWSAVIAGTALTVVPAFATAFFMGGKKQ